MSALTATSRPPVVGLAFERELAAFANPLAMTNLHKTTQPGNREMLSNIIAHAQSMPGNSYTDMSPAQVAQKVQLQQRHEQNPTISLSSGPKPHGDA